ncbi:response regulator [Cohnella sp. JJ-181]|uniref:response regulator n=1 Tax=Cohnella rhizoplanae TaxID=2974897 RepID=UPI0022FFB83B|nr:response regulator [Cohnella sp. JJ-181]CAI6086680.1 Protein-glutamate methylesterase/protein-glutamine glutaminase [Cohnella sp. JJ-181]
MYKVLLVDDERLILDGISRIVDWASAGTALAGTARNGAEAFGRIAELEPDIVITDVKMPVMDGLQLVERAHEAYPRIRFIVLSGFGEFEYASRAMQYGVKHYLLKPTNEHKIAGALAELIAELDEEARRDAFVRQMKTEMDAVMPHVKEQFLKEFVTNKTFGIRDWDRYRQLFALDYDYRVRLILFQLQTPFEFEHLFAIRNIAGEVLEQPLLSTTIGDHVLLVVRDEDGGDLQQRLRRIREIFQRYYKLKATVALSEPDHITNARGLYRETLSCLNYGFYVEEGSLITRKDTLLPSRDDAFSYDEERLCMAVRSGHLEEAEAALAEFIGGLREAQLDIGVAKSYVLQQFVALIRLCEPGRMSLYYGQIPALVEITTLHAIEHFLEQAAKEIAQWNYEQNVGRHSAIVRKVIAIVEDQLGNPELSLGWVAQEMLYMNADYLGKLFKKETGEKFSGYVTQSRIKRAMADLAADPDLKIFELAERLGFGDNPQYFSQIFKKYAGCTPSEYIKSLG